MRRLSGSVVGAVSLAFMFVFVSAVPANAHYVYEKAFVYRTDYKLCVWERSEISYGTGGGYSKVDGISKYYTDFHGGGACLASREQPQGYIIVKYDLMIWNPTRQQWLYCWISDTAYNKTRTSKFVLYSYYGDNPRCGKGWYGTWGTAKVWNGRTFKGGKVWSGPHWLE